MPPFQFVQHKGSRIPFTGGANFPKALICHPLEIGARGPEFRTMKDRLPARELGENFVKA